MSRTGPSLRRDPRGARRRGALSLLLSLGVHLLLSLIVGIPGLVCSPERERIGSDELDVDLVAPRLAPPLETWGQLGDRPGSPRAEVRAQGRKRGAEQTRPEASRDVKGRRVPERWTVPAPISSADERRARTEREAREREAIEHTAAQRARTEQREGQVRAKEATAAREARSPDRAQRPQPAAPSRLRRQSRLLVGVTPRVSHGELGAQREIRSLSSRAAADEAPRLAELPSDERGDSPLFRPNLPSEERGASQAVPDGPSPGAVLDAVQREVAQRERKRRSALEASRARFAAAEQQLALFARQSGRTARCSAGTYQASGAAGLGGRDAQGSRERLGGKAPRWGLKFYLSGRRVRNSRVVRPPEPLNMPSVRCKVTSLSITPATVRMLIETDGKVGHLYLKRSSGSARFDGCAMGHARKMRFRPGTDEAGLPLNVWINLRVEPGLLTTAGL